MNIDFKKRAKQFALFFIISPAVSWGAVTKGQIGSTAGRYPTTVVYDLVDGVANHECPDKYRVEDAIDLAMESNDNVHDPVELFSLPGIVRLIFRLKECRPESVDDLLGKIFSKSSDYLAHGTVNHALIRSTSWYLLMQLLSEEKRVGVTGAGTKPVREVQNELLSKLRIKLNGELRQLNPEITSTTYAILNFIPLLNLYDFSQDRDLKQLADKLLNVQYGVLRVNSLAGVILPPITRRNTDQRYKPDRFGGYTPAASQQILYNYSTDAPLLSQFELNGGRIPKFNSIMRASRWRPNRKIDELTDERARIGYSSKMRIPRFSFWGAVVPAYVSGGVDVKRSFGVGHGNASFEPSGYSSHIQTFSIAHRVDAEFNQIECVHPYFDRGADLKFGPGQWSPFVQNFRSSFGEVVLIGDIPAIDPYHNSKPSRFQAERTQFGARVEQVFYCRVPKHGFEYVLTDEGYLHVRSANAETLMAPLVSRFEFSFDTVDYNVFHIKTSKLVVIAKTQDLGVSNIYMAARKYRIEKGVVIWVDGKKSNKLEFGRPFEGDDGWVHSYPILNGVSTWDSSKKDEAFASDVFDLLLGEVKLK